MGFFREEYWSGLPFPSPGDLPLSWIERTSPALAGRFFTTEPLGKSMYVCIKFKYTHSLPVYVFILKLMEYGIMPALKSRIRMESSWHIVSHQKLLVIILISMKTLYYKLPPLSIRLPNLISSVLHRLRSFNSNYSSGFLLPHFLLSEANKIISL